jgi:16S rRNA (uracil1498-N3)-methyltransferase
MQRPRIYTPDALRTGATQDLPESAATHVTRVLRLAAGDPITLFDGSGTDYDAVLKMVARSRVSAEVGAGRQVERESPLEVTLLQGVSRGPRMDTVVQKATELGVHRLQPVLANRSVVRLDAERGEARLDHWRRIVISACEQCGRSVLPDVLPARSLDDALSALEPGTVGLTLDPRGDGALGELLGTGNRVALAIGPEGGFTEDEIHTLTRAGFRGLRLGPRILRTETAPLAALAILQYARGDLGSGRAGRRS